VRNKLKRVRGSEEWDLAGFLTSVSLGLETLSIHLETRVRRCADEELGDVHWGQSVLNDTDSD
jgi:hypothetical protein